MGWSSYVEENRFSSHIWFHKLTHTNMNIFNEDLSERLTATRARPKSQIFRSQVVFSNKLLGFRSLQRTIDFAFRDDIISVGF